MSVISVAAMTSFINMITLKKILERKYKNFENNINNLFDEIKETSKKEKLFGEDVQREIDDLHKLKMKLLVENENNLKYLPPEELYKEIIDKSLYEFKKQCLKVKKLFYEVLTKKQKILGGWGKIKEFTEFIEVSKIKRDIDNINILSTNDLDEILHKIEQASEFIEYFLQKSQEIKELLSSKGKGELHKEISAWEIKIEELKDSDTPHTQKIAIMEEYIERIRNFATSLDNISSMINATDLKGYSMEVVLSEMEEDNKLIGEDKKIIEKEKNIIRNEINRYLCKLEEIDKEEHEKFLYDVQTHMKDDNLIILRNIRDRLKIKYGNLKERYNLTQVYKEEIRKILEDRDLEYDEIKSLGLQMLEKKYIDDKEFWQFFKEYKNQKEKLETKKETKKAFRKFMEILNSKGYFLVCDDKTIEEISEYGEIFEISSPQGKDYKVQVKLDEQGNIITRFSKEVEEEISDYEKQRDIEEAKNWCKIYKDTIAQMKKEGIPLDIIATKEPEEAEINYIKKRSKKRESEDKKVGKRIEQEKKLY